MESEKSKTGKLMKYRMILFYGTSGSGKSTLSHFVQNLIQEKEISTELISESDFSALKEFRPLVESAVDGKIQDLEITLSCFKKYLLTRETSDIFIIHDLVLPCWYWLALSGFSIQEIKDFSNSLAPSLKSFNPLMFVALVYLFCKFWLQGIINLITGMVAIGLWLLPMLQY